MRNKQKVIHTLLCTVILMTALTLSSCKKTCHCYGYDGSHHYFTAEEVKERGGACSSLINFANVARIYSICEWDNTK